ncbi:MAG: DUF4388 domain-containing protein [Deltaproteobacteria bacterium]|nr:DUF4388 domain-containing protein [Deltaproteobacteria bacterium]
MSLKGNFESFFLASVLQLLANDKKTGILHIKEGKNQVKVYLEEGTIIYAIGSQTENRLGHLLRSKGVISEENLKKCLEEARGKNEQVGKILVESGCVSIAELETFIHQQVENILYSLFLWQKGEFEYEDATFNLKGAIVTQLNTMELILEASRRVDELSVLRKQIPDDLAIFRLSDEGSSQDEIKLNSQEWRMLSLIDGKRTVRDVIDESGFDDFMGMKFFYSLVSSGLIAKREGIIIEEPGRNKTGEVIVDYRDIIKLYYDILQIISTRFEKEIGKQALTIFNESVEDLIPQQKELLRNFRAKDSLDENNKHLTNALRTYKSFREGRAFLIISFNDLLRGLLARGVAILGKPPLQKTQQEIEKVLSYIDTHREGSTEKVTIINTIKSLLKKTLQQDSGKGEEKERRGGRFSLFKTK